MKQQNGGTYWDSWGRRDIYLAQTKWFILAAVCEIGQYISDYKCTDCSYDEWADNPLPDLSTGCSTCNELYGTNVTMATSADQCYRK